MESNIYGVHLSVKYMKYEKIVGMEEVKDRVVYTC
jgi:hypothetical protein